MRMKLFKIAVVLLFGLSLCAVPLTAQDEQGASDLLDDDVDSLFDESGSEETDTASGDEGKDNDKELEKSESEDSDSEESAKDEGDLLSELEKKPGFTFTARYNFRAGYTLDWNFRPWEWKSTTDHVVRNKAIAGLNSTFSFDVQLTPELEVTQKIDIGFADFRPDMREFYADYRIGNEVFFRLGLQGLSWGRSRSYPFTNIVSRTPPGEGGGDMYAIKMNVPVGIGGIETVALTRKSFVDDFDDPSISDIGIGAKYNLALPAADIDIGTFFHRKLKYRSFYSVKTTLFDRLEVYQEGMLGVDLQENYAGMSFAEVLESLDGSASIGFYDDYINNRLKVNVEYFFNGETAGNAFDLDDELDEEEEEPSPFIYGHNTALTLSYKPGSSSLRLGARYKHNFNEQTGYLAPGLTFSPLPDVRVSIAAPMVVGGKNGAYYQDNKNKLFRLALDVKIGEKYQHTVGK